jgi:molecular chaperone HtpG
MKQGNLGVQTENVLPIIKRFLYSDQEIFLRELISNAVDASKKIQTLSNTGQFEGELGDLTIQVGVDKDNKYITIRDRGIGMTEEEVQEYINEIAFSSAGEFMQQFQDEQEKGQIIGKFGLGFYSAFMVSDKVEIVTRSYKEGAQPVKWTGTGDSSYQIDEVEKEERGTEIRLHISEDAEEYLEEERIKNLLSKYCGFMPVPIQFNNEVINDTNPLWNENPAELTNQNYQDFYQKLYPGSQPPLFWIHLNVDYPFTLTGILYFPKLSNQLEVQRNKIQLYANQVYVTDNVEDIVPEFLTLLHGVMDSPDIPLNVSRSNLQADSRVKKISNYIVKKVAEKLESLFNEDRKNYEEKYEDIHVFLKYGFLTNDKFKEKAQPLILLKNTEGKYFTTEEYKNQVKELQTDKDGNTVFLYTTDKDAQQTYIEGAQKRNYDVLVFDHPIDSHFIQTIEGEDENVQVKRVDADSLDNLIDTGESKESVLNEEQQNQLKETFNNVINDEQITVETEAHSPDDPPLVITQAEFTRRMKEMSQMSGMGMDQLPDQYNVKINTNHSLANKILVEPDTNQKQLYAQEAYDLARLSHGMLKGEDLSQFVNRTLDLMNK